MNIVKRVDQYDEANVFFCEPIKNNVMDDGNFVRILYSNSFCTLNGVYVLLSITATNVEKYYNKYKIFFDKTANSEIIDKICEIENSILQKVNITSRKTPQRKLHEQFKNGNIKIFVDQAELTNQHTFLLKISGVWETEDNYGVTYKFIRVDNH